MSIIAPKEITLKNGKTITLKSPVPEDAENLLNHLKNLFQTAYRNMNHPKNHWDHVTIEDEFRILTDFKNSDQKFMISAFDGDKIIGNLGLFGFGGEFLKHNARLGMGLEPDYQNLGLGSALMSYALESAKQINIKRVELTVRTFNQAGIKLYEKAGFRQVGLLKNTAFIDGEYCDEYMYEILLG